mgnify:CR=1 FL=1
MGVPVRPIVQKYDFAVFNIVDESTNVLVSEVCDYSCSTSVSAGLSDAGVYFIIVGSESSYTAPSGSYTMEATFEAGTLSGVEIAPNDTVPHQVSSGESIVGTMS